MRIVIPSRGRWDTIGQEALRVFPDATLCVHESEAEHYLNLSQAPMLVHPDDVTGIAPVFQWILDHVDEDCVVIVSDDVTHAYDQTGVHKRRIEDAATCQAIVERLAILARDAGVRVFGFQQAARPLTYKNFKPFQLSSWTGGVIGIIGRELRYDPRLLLRADIDFCLQSLRRDRIVLIDGRYSFIHRRFEGRGGNAANRSAERHAAEISYLRTKWGPYLQAQPSKTTMRLVVRVPR